MFDEIRATSTPFKALMPAENKCGKLGKFISIFSLDDIAPPITRRPLTAKFHVLARPQQRRGPDFQDLLLRSNY
jgi:hypothetical protein